VRLVETQVGFGLGFGSILGLGCVECANQSPYQTPCTPTQPPTTHPRAGEGSRGALLWGQQPAEPVVFRENGVAFESDIVMGQKTGFFLDQRDNRQRMQVGFIGDEGGG
jgi:hypothetical protein